MRAAALLSLLLLASSVWACGPLRLTYFDYPGLYHRSPDGVERGLDVDLVRAMAERSGCRFEFHATSAKRGWQAMVAGELDVVVTALRTPERDLLYEHVGFARSRALVLMSRAQGARLQRPQSFVGDGQARLLIVRGTSYTPKVSQWVESLRGAGRLSEAGDMPAAMRAFEAGRAEALLIYPMALAGRDRAWLAQQSLLDWWPEETAYGGWAVSRRTVSAADRQRLRLAADSLLRDGTVMRLASEHLGPELAAHFVHCPQCQGALRP